MRIEFGELKIGKIAQHHLNDVVKSNWASSGEKVKLFEEKWSNLFKYKHSKAVSSGTDAVINAVLSLYEFGAKRGDEVIVPALSFIATANAVLAAGFKPVFVDIKAETLNINPSLIEEKITNKTKAILPVHTMGKMCEMDKIKELALKYDLWIIEDACEAHGARYKGKFVGEWGDSAAFSFYIAHLICCGEGGMVSTNNNLIADSVNATRSHGRKNGLYFDHQLFGLNSKMNDMEASLGLEGIENFWNTFFRRKNNLYFLMNKLDKYRRIAFMNTEDPWETVCPHGYSITFRDPLINVKEFSNFLEKKEIKVKRNFGCIPTQHKSFEWMGHKLGEFPIAEYVGNHGIHFGIHQYLSQEDLEYIVNSVEEGFKLYV